MKRTTRHPDGSLETLLTSREASRYMARHHPAAKARAEAQCRLELDGSASGDLACGFFRGRSVESLTAVICAVLKMHRKGYRCEWRVHLLSGYHPSWQDHAEAWASLQFSLDMGRSRYAPATAVPVALN